MDRLELMNTRERFHRDLLSRNICVAACVLEISHKVRLRSDQTGPASLAPERRPKAGSKRQRGTCGTTNDQGEATARLGLVCVERLETYHRDLLSRSISASGSMSVVGHEVRLRKVPTGPELGWASLAQRVADEEVS